MTPAPDPTRAAKRERLKRQITWLGVVLIALGAIVLLVLRQLPFPLRAIVGFVDMGVGIFLLLVLRPKFDR